MVTAGEACSLESGFGRRSRRCGTRFLRVAALGVISGGLALASAAAARPSGEPPAHVFGATPRPRVSVTVEPPETPGGPCYLSLVVLAGNAIETQAATSDQGPPATCRPTPHGHEVVGTSRIEGREIRYRATVSLDWRAMAWTQPAAVTLRDGSAFQLAGRYEKQTEPARLALAKAAFGRGGSGGRHARTRHQPAWGRGQRRVAASADRSDGAPACQHCGGIAGVRMSRTRLDIRRSSRRVAHNRWDRYGVGSGHVRVGPGRAPRSASI